MLNRSPAAARPITDPLLAAWLAAGRRIAELYAATTTTNR